MNKLNSTFVLVFESQLERILTLVICSEAARVKGLSLNV